MSKNKGEATPDRLPPKDVAKKVQDQIEGLKERDLQPQPPKRDEYHEEHREPLTSPTPSQKLGRGFGQLVLLLLLLTVLVMLVTALYQNSGGNDIPSDEPVLISQEINDVSISVPMATASDDGTSLTAKVRIENKGTNPLTITIRGMSLIQTGPALKDTAGFIRDNDNGLISQWPSHSGNESNVADIRVGEEEPGESSSSSFTVSTEFVGENVIQKEYLPDVMDPHLPYTLFGQKLEAGQQIEVPLTFHGLVDVTNKSNQFQLVVQNVSDQHHHLWDYHIILPPIE